MRGSSVESRGAYNAYSLYSALRLHFTSNYDAVKFNFKTKVSGSSFEKRNDKAFFDRAAKQYPSREKLIDYFVYNFIDGKSYVLDMTEDNYFKHKRIKESIHRIFSIDLQRLEEALFLEEENTDFDNLFISNGGQHPLVVQLWLQDEICLETVVILNSMLNFVHREDKNIRDTILWPELRSVIQNFEPFVKYDADKCKTMLRQVFK